ncbi:hypothetical protein [Streptomyces beihaiensis]|uniref:Uncharacterized protein n=1 Tax=Streptomyces beihaiensis TaxID=2984495 RepID=A0ABT3U4X7_9ACTN|nr:hypothetical protein [Streptomyces beihaiensis]MCX3063706.1 hypothetical protein [Streptomyces beihaiensis]
MSASRPVRGLFTVLAAALLLAATLFLADARSATTVGAPKTGSTATTGARAQVVAAGSDSLIWG